MACGARTIAGLGIVLFACSSSSTGADDGNGAGGSSAGASATTGGAANGGTAAQGGRTPMSQPGAGGSARGGATVAAGGVPVSAGGVLTGAGGATTGAAGTTSGVGGSAGAAGVGGVSASGGAAGSSGAAGGSGAGGAGTMHPYKGVANSPCAARTALGVSWYYNWEQKEKEPCSDGRGGEFVPMIWGHTGAEQTASSIRSAVQGMAAAGYTNVLGFNEPDNSSQSNIPVATAISLWPSFDAPGIRVGSPGTAANANPGQAWFKDFMSKLGADSTLRTDFLAIHWYGWNSGSCDAKASQLESYVKWAEGFPGNRPIWITEWGCLNQSAPDVATVVSFYKGAVAMFAKHPRIERYAWYPWATNCALNDKDGALTELGTAYAAEPAFR